MRKKFKFYICASLFGIFFLCIREVKAQLPDGADISFSPVIEHLTLEPGSSRDGTIRVTNPGNTYMKYQVNARPFTTKADQPGVPFPISEEKARTYPYDASRWFSFSLDSFTLDPLEVQEFDYEINIPEDVSPGGYYAGIFFGDISEGEKKEESDVGVTLVGGPIFLIKVPGELNECVEVTDFKTSRKLYELLPCEFTTVVRNCGNVHIVPRGEIEVTNMFGDKVATMNVNSEKYNVLPDHSNIFTNQWSEGTGLFDKLLTEDKKILLGKMEAKLVLLYRSEDPGYDYKVLYTTFWIIPWKFILIVALLIVLALAIWRYRKWRDSGVRKYYK